MFAGGAGAAETQWRDFESRIQYGYYTEDARALHNLADALAQDDSHDRLRGYYAGLAAWRLAQLTAQSPGGEKGAPAAQLAQRCVKDLDAVLEAIYAAFSHGWAEAFSDDPRGRNLAEEAIWLGRVVVSLIPNEPEAMGLLALMLYAHSRREARRDAQGRYVPLSDQEVERWDRSAIEEAEGLLHAASALGAPGRFQLEAAVQSAHAARRLTGTTDWEAIAVLYDALFALTASPVVAVNRAAAVAHAHGPAAGLELLDEVGAKGGLAGFEPYWVARADLCAKLGEVDAARSAYSLAIGLQTDPAARAFLIEQLAALA